MNEIGTAIVLVATTPIWLAWLRGLARLLWWSLLPVLGAVLAPFLMLALGSFLDGIFGLTRGTGAATLFLSIPVVLLGWIVVVIVRSAWREMVREWLGHG